MDEGVGWWVLGPKEAWFGNPVYQKKKGYDNACISEWEELLKFKDQGREFANFWRSLEQFVKGQNNFC